ncbi:PTS sugar transporter subunit IIBC [Pedobacter sp. KBW01]|nr:PTS sugar transporter subunit IIBC [Pedobacter sp. KBW01]
MNFVDKRMSVKRAAAILAKSGMQVNDNETSVILDFLYLLAKNYNKHEYGRNDSNPKGKSNHEKTL